MASINGISAKNIKRFKGHEEEPLCQGNLYLGNKKLGFWSQGDWGGPDDFNLAGEYSERRLNEAVKRLNPEKAYRGGTPEKPFVLEYDLELLMGDFVCLWMDEQKYKKAIKDGYAGILIATDGYHAATWHLPKSYVEMSDEVLLEKMAGAIAKAEESFFEERNGHNKHIVKIYRSGADFDIGEPVKIEDVLAVN